jgi:hypothetical protein
MLALHKSADNEYSVVPIYTVIAERKAGLGD